MNFLSKRKHDQAKESTHQNWGILFPLILLIGGGTVAGILLEYPDFLIYLTKVSPFFEARLTKISPKHILQVGNDLIYLIVDISSVVLIGYIKIAKGALIWRVVFGKSSKCCVIFPPSETDH